MRKVDALDGDALGVFILTCALILGRAQCRLLNHMHLSMRSMPIMQIERNEGT
jgi:hypothetical protein